ncbi:hypothetical protein STENM36S_06775 [Streptomyces tendae]
MLIDLYLQGRNETAVPVGRSAGFMGADTHYIQLHASEAGKSVHEAAGFVAGR